MENKYKFWKRMRSTDGVENIAELQSRIRQNYINKFYNLWMSKFKWSGLDEEQATEQENYIMRKFWSDGRVACRNLEKIGMLAFTPFAEQDFDMYDFPSTVNLINLRGVSKSIIPDTAQVVGKDVVIGWCEPNRKPIQDIVNYYVDRITQVELVVNTNLQLHKMPWIIGVDEADRNRMEDVVNRILNNEVVVFSDLGDLNRIKSLATQTPYIIDKLHQYKNDLENELLSYLGVDNIGQEKKERLVVDEANSNNDMINAYGDAIEDEIKKFLSEINRVFGREIKIEPKLQRVNTNSEAIRSGNPEAAEEPTKEEE